MAEEDKHSDKLGVPGGEVPEDDATQLKKRARRRLIGAVALTLLAAILLPMVMDHQPAPSLKDIQVRIPSPDEGVTQRVTPKPANPALHKEKSERAEKAEKAEKAERLPSSHPVEPVPQAKSAEKSETRPIARLEPKSETKPETKPEVKPEPKHESKPLADEVSRAQNALAGKAGGESWEVQLGAYQDPARVRILLAKLKEMRVPTFTETVDTPNGPRTRVRAGPYPSQEAAEKARGRVKIVGVDGPVAKRQ